MTDRLRSPKLPRSGRGNPREATFAIPAASGGQVETASFRAGMQVVRPDQAWHATIIDARDGALPEAFPGLDAALSRAGTIFSLSQVTSEVAALIATRAIEGGAALVILRPPATAAAWRALIDKHPGRA